VTEDDIERVRTLLDGPSPSVLTTYRRDASAHVSPVWFRWHDAAFEIVIAEGDVKLAHLERDPRCVLVAFETVRPFRGIEVRSVPELIPCDVTPVREAIAGRYLGRANGERFAAVRMTKPGVLLRLSAEDARIWDLAGILPVEAPG